MLRFIVIVPVLAVLVAFAVSNPQPVTLAFWPTDKTIGAPLAIAVLAISAGFFLLGATVVWVPGLGTRWRARRAEKRVAKLQAKLAKRSKTALAA
jgi:uncharacterized integral membrane protein